MTKDKDTTPNTDAGKLWLKIKDKTIDVFGLTGQIVSKYFEPMFLDDKSLHLKYKVPASVPAVELVLGTGFTCEQVEIGGTKLLVIKPDLIIEQNKNSSVTIESK